jgi:hypothetical protein
MPNAAKLHAFGHAGYVHIPAGKRVKGEKFEPRAIRGHLIRMFDKHSKTPTKRPSTVSSTPSPQSSSSHPRIGRFQPLLERLSMDEQPTPGGEDEDPGLPQAGNLDDFDSFEEPQVNTPEPTCSNNVAPRREDINADFSERHTIQGPRARRARVNFTSNDLQPLQLYTDNQPALNMVRKDGHHERTKHIDNYYRYTK